MLSIKENLGQGNFRPRPHFFNFMIFFDFFTWRPGGWAVVLHFAI